MPVTLDEMKSHFLSGRLDKCKYSTFLRYDLSVSLCLKEKHLFTFTFLVSKFDMVSLKNGSHFYLIVIFV